MLFIVKQNKRKMTYKNTDDTLKKNIEMSHSL